MRNVMLSTIAFTLLIIGAVDVPAATGETAQQRDKQGTVGSFQLVTGFDGRLYMVDTRTGQCWSKSAGGDWVDIGNPARPKPPTKRKRLPIDFRLPKGKVEFTIHQRRWKSIPGSSGRLRIHLGDITAGQVLLRIQTDGDVIILDDTSLRSGDVVKFRVAKKDYFIELASMTNVLIGDDFAVLRISRTRPKRSSTTEGLSDGAPGKGDTR